MTETRRIQLHLGKCIEDLDQLHNVPDLKSKRATLLCKTAQKLFESAEEAREKGDEEYSYVYYMKYLRVIAYISKDKDYLKDKTYFNNMLGAKNPNKAIDYAEKLKNSLIDRYQKEQKTKRLNDIKENELIKQKIDENRKKTAETTPVIEPPQPLGLPGPDEVTIKSEQLYTILKSGKLKVMILDARPGKDYVESHINCPACISVPEEVISPGQSANVLEQNLPAASRPVWADRATMELIIMLDWNSTAVIPGKTLHLLKTILLKWDVKVHYARQPLALHGGYEDWLLKYPAFTTNPQCVPPRQDDIIMLGNRRNLIFRVSIVFNIAVFLYAAVHYSGNSPQGVEWVPITSDGSERAAELRYLKEDVRNDTVLKLIEPSARIFGEFTSQKVVPSTMSTVKQKEKRPSTTADVDKKISAVPSEANIINETLEAYDENVLSDSTLTLLRALLGCNDKDFIPETMQRGEFWVLKNYVRANHGAISCHESITYTTHGGFEFLDNLLPLIERWMAPVSLAIHAPGSDMLPTVNSIRYLRDCTSSDLVMQYATFHIFFSNKHIPSNIPDPEIFLKTPYNCTDKPPYVVNSSTTYKQQKNLLYPINVGRNIARSAALTHFVLPSDIELYPSPDLAAKFLNMIARNEPPLSTSTNPRVFPLSLFEVDKNYVAPWTKTELQSMLKNKTAIPFHKYVCPTCHNIPNGKEWMAAPEAKYMGVFHVGKRIGKQSHWEPIFIGTNEEPYYDERLSWEGKQDKMTQGYILCVKDYDFMILNNAFLVHKPGIKYYKKNVKRDKIGSKQSSYVRNVILPELKKLFGVKHGCVL